MDSISATKEIIIITDRASLFSNNMVGVKFCNSNFKSGTSHIREVLRHTLVQCELTPTQPIVEVNKYEYGLEPTVTEVNIQK